MITSVACSRQTDLLLKALCYKELFAKLNLNIGYKFKKIYRHKARSMLCLSVVTSNTSYLLPANPAAYILVIAVVLLTVIPFLRINRLK